MKRNIAKLVVILIGSFLMMEFYRCPICDSRTDARIKHTGQTLEAQLNYPVETIYLVAKEVVEVLELEEIVEIRLEELSQFRTLLVIRVDTFGDKNKSNVIFNQIVENLREES